MRPWEPLALSPWEYTLGCVNISPMAVPGLWFESFPVGTGLVEGMAHKISPEQAQGPRTQVLLSPCPTGVKECDITEGMKLCSQQPMLS